MLDYLIDTTKKRFLIIIKNFIFTIRESTLSIRIYVYNLIDFLRISLLTHYILIIDILIIYIIVNSIYIISIRARTYK